jgi:hypothetical protein
MSRWQLAAAATLAVWCALELAVRRTDAITDDHHGWRQADTQAIARNLAFEDFDPLHPRIDWRGDGPGFVETEAQLYPTLIALAMQVTGESLWPGQLISLLSVALAAAILFATLSRRFDERAGFVALLAVLGHRGTVVAATSIQPDPMAFLCFTIGWVAFVAWLEAPRPRTLITWVAATALAGLIKPTTLELGLAQGLYVLLAHRAALRRPALWIGWAIVLALVGAFLLHARGLYTDYGNTFGVLSGGDSKLPAPAMLARVETWWGLARFSTTWGVGAGVLAALYLGYKRRLGKEEAALAVAALVLILLALRYTSGEFGTHYHLPHVVLGAWLVARAVHHLPVHRAVMPLVIAFALFHEARALHWVRTRPAQPETAVGAMLAAHAAPGDLVVVRARAPRVDPDWKTVNNCEDPRLFYLSRTRGWVLANDEPGADRLADHAARGARWYAHVEQMAPDAELAAWLAAHAEEVARGPEGAIYRLTIR